MNVITQSTKEREEETVELFKKVKPLLDKGLALSTAVRQIKGYTHNGFQNRRWYKDLRAYAKENGYRARR